MTKLEFNKLLDELFTLAQKEKPTAEYVDLLWQRFTFANHEALRWAMEQHPLQFATLRAGENLAHRLMQQMARWHEMQADMSAPDKAVPTDLTPEEEERANAARELFWRAFHGDVQAKRVLEENRLAGMRGRG